MLEELIEGVRQHSYQLVKWCEAQALCDVRRTDPSALVLSVEILDKTERGLEAGVWLPSLLLRETVAMVLVEMRPALLECVVFDVQVVPIDMNGSGWIS